ncbi:MAG TPA: 6-phosphogluconolactonase [Dermatophilaceae bacterium]
MSQGPTVVVHHDRQLLAEDAGARLVMAILNAQSSRGQADIVLTGGSMGSAILVSLGRSPAKDAIDWRTLNIWWGDERFLPAGDPERNETQARNALLDVVPLDPSRVHPMPASDGPDGSDVDAAAARYARELASAAHNVQSGHGVPEFDVLLLGLGPDAHVASLFPEHPALQEREQSTIGVRGAPKPPPTRVSMTFPSLCAARDVWFLVAGADKAGAVGLALSGAGLLQAPAAGVVGTRSTTWLLDREAATHVPKQLIRLADH